MKTRLTELLGIEAPIICGGMMRVGTADLAAAVSNAGGLGIMTALTQKTPEGLKAEIEKCQALTDKPFGVNITVGVVTTQVDYAALVEVIVNSGVKIVETAGRSPEPFMPFFKAAGIKVIHKCVTVRHSLAAERLGVDVVSIDGFECAGHPGEQDVGGLVLFPAAADKVKIPLLASGGFGDGRGLVAALVLGADGVNMGTRFTATVEAPIHQGIKDAMVANDERGTDLIFRSYRNTARVAKNAISQLVVAAEREGKPFEAVADLVKGVRGREGLEIGDADHGVWSAGLVQGLIHDIPTCAELLMRMVADAEAIIKARLGGMLV